MKSLLKEWKVTKKKLEGKNIFLFLDYDGTLASIAGHPDQAFLSREVRQTLEKLITDPGVRVAVISGRSLQNIKKKVGIKGIIYSGNHGLEIEGPSFAYQHPLPPSFIATLNKIKKDLHQTLAGVKGIIIEDKKLTLAIHYRLADKKLLPGIRAALHQSIGTHLPKKIIGTRTGKMVIEIIPPVKWNKGLAVKWILQRPEFSGKDFFPLYLGDDRTDEDAFRVLKNKGLTALVGRRNHSNARYYLNNVSEGIRFAERLQEFRGI